MPIALHTYSKWFATILLVLIVAIRAAYAAEPSVTQEYKIKAAYLYRVSHFVDWPEGTFTNGQSPFVVCVIGKPEIANALAIFTGKTVKKKQVQVKPVTTIEEMCCCHVLFIGISERLRLEELLNHAEKKHILTVSDLPDFSRAGGILELINQEDKVHFNINLRAARKSGLGIHSQLLQLAHDVIE